MGYIQAEKNLFINVDKVMGFLWNRIFLFSFYNNVEEIELEKKNKILYKKNKGKIEKRRERERLKRDKLEEGKREEGKCSMTFKKINV